MKIIFCTFKRTEKSKQESGFFVEAENQLIVDQKGNVVKAPVWDYDQQPYKLCVDVPDNYNGGSK